MFELETLRLIKKTFRRFLSLTLIVMLGAGFMMGLMSTKDIMLRSVDKYYDEYETQDATIYSSYGFSQNDYKALLNYADIDTVYPSKTIDLEGTFNDKDNTYVFRVAELNRNNNLFHLVEGRMPASANECILINKQGFDNYTIGDRIHLNYGKNDISEYLSESEYNVVGLYESPENLNRMLGNSNYNNKELDYIVMIPNTNFLTDYFTAMHITFSGSRDYISDSSAYEKFMDEKLAAFDDFVQGQQTIHRDEILAEYTEQLEEKEELFQQMKEYGQQELDNAEKLLRDANIQISAYEGELNALNATIQGLQASIQENAGLFQDIYSISKQNEQIIADLMNRLGIEGSFNYGTTAMDYLYNSYYNAISQFNSLQGMLVSARAEYEEGKKEYEENLEKYNQEIEDGELQLRLARQQLQELPQSEWIILDHNLIYSATSYKNTCSQMGQIGTYLPLMFFLVAALVCLTTMKRLIEEQRSQIGIFVALGFSDGKIIMKYVLYALLASLIGGTIGICIGQFSLPFIIYNAWAILYILPPMELYIPIQNVIISLFSFTLIMCGVSTYVVCSELKDVPAVLMRPKAPRKGKEIILEKIGIIWNHMSFTSKITARNIFRYKSRFMMTIIGIAGCTGLLIMGFGIIDSVHDVLDIQYNELIHFNEQIILEDSSHTDENMRKLMTDPDYQAVTQFMSYRAKSYVNDKETIVSAVVLDPNYADNLFTFRDTRHFKPFRLTGNGVIVTERFAQINNIKIGDTITIESESGLKAEAPVTNICEMYVNHYIFMTDSYYTSLFHEKINNTQIALYTDNTEKILKDAAKLNGYVSVLDFSSIQESFAKMTVALNYIVYVIILISGALAYVVLMNLTQVNISERVREIATLKVLGFKDHEVNMYIFNEIFLLSMIGCVCGIPIGILEQRMIMNAIAMDTVLFGRNINLTSFLFSIAITIVFTLIVLFFTKKPLRNIDMVESLKSVE